MRVLNRGDRRSPQAMQDQADIVSMKHGNQAAYIRARLRRDAPEVADALERGEFKSARKDESRGSNATSKDRGSCHP